MLFSFLFCRQQVQYRQSEKWKKASLGTAGKMWDAWKLFSHNSEALPSNSELSVGNRNVSGLSW